MKRMKVGSWTIEVDVEQTKRFYDGFHLITDDCICDYCANYILACNQFPLEIKDFFVCLGIDPCKEGEVSEYMKNQDGTHFYRAFYHVVGRIIKGPKLWNEDTSVHNLAGFEIGFTEVLDLVPEGFPMPTVQVEFQMNIPWLLNEWH